MREPFLTPELWLRSSRNGVVQEAIQVATWHPKTFLPCLNHRVFGSLRLWESRNCREHQRGFVSNEMHFFLKTGNHPSIVLTA